MKKLLVLLGILMATGLVLTGCDVGYALAHGNASTRSYDYTGFTGVDIGSAFEFEIVRGETYSVSITADDYSHIVVEEIDHTLKISRRGVDWTPAFFRPVAKITSPALTSLNVSGASAGKVSGFQGGNLVLVVSGASRVELNNMQVIDLTGSINGASRVDGDLTATGQAVLEISGASHVNLTGAVKELELEVSGASRTEFYDFIAESGEVDYSGASSGTINVTGQLDVSLTGASNLNLRGSAEIGRMNTSGASNFHRK